MKGVVIGRFQPFHKGHETVVNAALDECDEVIVGIGSSQASGTARDPWTFEQRRAMVNAVFPQLRVVAIPDIFDPPNWVAHVQRIVGDFDVAYGNHNETITLFEEAGFAARRPGLAERAQWEGTRIRAQMLAGDDGWKQSVPAAVIPLAKLQDSSGIHQGHGR